jgi:hypothetical protein
MSAFTRIVLAPSVGVLLLSSCAPDVAEPPHASLQRLRRAVETGDTTAVLQYIDPEQVAARLVHDIWATVRDSIHVPRSHTFSLAVRAKIDSVERQVAAALRTQLGLSGDSIASDAPTSTADDTTAETPRESYPSEDVFADGVEIVGDGRVRYVGDTALVDRILKYQYLDTTATLRLALVPVEARHWRIVAFHNAVALLRVIQQRQLAVLERANKPLRDSIATRVSTRDFAVSREPLEEWDRYAAVVRVTLQNQSADPIIVYSAQLVGPAFSLEDTLGQLLPRPLTLAPSATAALVWQRDLRGDDVGVYELVDQPDRYHIDLTDVQWGANKRGRVRLYHTWHEFVQRNPLPVPSSGGVLAGASAWSDFRQACARLCETGKVAMTNENSLDSFRRRL